MGKWVFEGCKQPTMGTRTNYKEEPMNTLDNSLVEPTEVSAVGSLRPKRRWKTSPSQSHPVISEALPGPITGSGSRGPRLKKSGRAAQLWSSKPMHEQIPAGGKPAGGKLPTRLRIQELITHSIRDSLSFAHFSHSH